MMTQGHEPRGRSEGPPAPLGLVERQLREAEEFLLEAVSSDNPFVSVLAQHLVRAGGKRIRVALAHLGAGFGDRGRTGEADVRKLAAAIEMTHLATLHHDDIIDEADTRHGVPSVNAQWSNTLAILSGDYLFAKSSQLAAELGGEVPIVLAKTIASLCEGQIREIESTFRTDRSLDDYLYVIERKTARLFAAAAYLGARVGGADAPVAHAVERYAVSFGIAFQVADDLLDFLGDEEKIGKPPGTDIKAGVYTLPLLHAIGEGLQVGDLLRDADLPRVVKVLHEAGSFLYTRGVAERYAGQALAELADLPDVPERAALEGLVDFLLRRLPVSSAA